MTTRSISPSEWRSALDRFSLAHQGWPVTVEILPPAMGAQPVVIELPLSAISLSAPDDDAAIAVTMSRRGPDHITHVVEHVRRISVDHEAGAALAVETADGTRMRLRFLNPAADTAFANARLPVGATCRPGAKGGAHASHRSSGVPRTRGGRARRFAPVGAGHRQRHIAVDRPSEDDA